MSDSLWPHGLYSSWNSLGQNTGAGSLFLLQGIFPNQGSNPGLSHCRGITLPDEPQGKPFYHKCGIICIPEVIDISPGNLDSSLNLPSPAFCMMYSVEKLNKQGDNIQTYCTPFLIWNQSKCSMSGSNCCFLTCIQISQEVGKVVWYSHLFQNFPQFIVIHTKALT